MRLLALGDSYTIGEGVAEPERWPSQLVARLGEQGIVVRDTVLIAQTAWTTDELSDAIDAAAPRGPFDLVSLMTGVNDQYRSRPVAGFAAEFERLIHRAIALAGKRPHRVLAISIPDWGATPFARDRDRDRIGREIAQFNERARELATRACTHWIDVTPASRMVGTDPSLVVADGLHPSGAMYAVWAKQIADVALDALRAE